MMGRRGPKPKTKVMLELGQSWRASLAKDSPVPQPGVPTCPRWMNDPEARRCWRQTVAQLQLMRTLSKADANALVRYCVTWARWVRAHQHVLKYGEAYPLKDQNGTLRCFMPYVQSGVSIKLSQHLSQLEAEFGLTPASRTRLRPEYASPQEQQAHALMIKFGVGMAHGPYDPAAQRRDAERAKRKAKAAARRKKGAKARRGITKAAADVSDASNTQNPPARIDPSDLISQARATSPDHPPGL
jgi:P27 family predicted phage terminase small subunit